MTGRPIAIDLFCGVGGMSLGFERAGFRVAAAVDSRKINVDTHGENFPRVAAICADIRKMTGKEIRRRAGIGRARIAVVFGGPPCQGFSIGGARKTEDPRNLLILEFARLVVELRPRYFVMENVGGLLRPQYAPLLGSFVDAVAAGGYTIVTPIQRLDAARFGVPQRRRRAFVLGHGRGEVAPSYPEPKKSLPITVGAAIDDLLRVEGAALVDGDGYRGPLGPPSAYAKKLRMKVGGRGSGAAAPTLLSGFTRTEHSLETTRRFALVKPGKVDAISRFIRLDRAGVSPTLRAGTGSENGRFMAPRPIHPTYARCICLREAARLHSFPDWFVFHKTKWNGFMQIGNSVPPVLARAVATRVMKALRREP